MKYSQLVSMVKPFFITRGLEILGPNTNLNLYIHMGVQVVWNYRDWSFKRPSEKISPVEVEVDGIKVYRYKTNHPIRKVSVCMTYASDQKMYNGRDFIIHRDASGNYLEFKRNNGDMMVTYFVLYNWINLDTSTDIDLPFTDDFVPACVFSIFDIASPLVTFEGERTPNYVKMQNELTRLADIDGIQDDGAIEYDND